MIRRSGEREELQGMLVQFLSKKCAKIKDGNMVRLHLDSTHSNFDGEDKGRQDTDILTHMTTRVDWTGKNCRLFYLLLFKTVVECLRRLNLSPLQLYKVASFEQSKKQ